MKKGGSVERKEMVKLSVEDYLEIQQLYARYSHTIDSAQEEAWADTFTPDGVWSQGFLIYRGRDQLAAFARTSFKLYGGYRHIQTNILFGPEDGKIKGSSYFMFIVLGGWEWGKPATIAGTARYRDELVKTDKGWRFKSRAVVPDEASPIPAPEIMPNPDGIGGPSMLFKYLLDYLKETPTEVSLEALRQRPPAPDLTGSVLEQKKIGGVPACILSPQGIETDDTILYFHGGGYVTGSPPLAYLPFAAHLAQAAKAKVIVSDYRLAPESPFPAAYDDGLATYRWLVASGGVNPKKLALIGDSAGSGLAIAVSLGARDEGLPMPAAVAAISPFVDMSLSGETIDDQKRDPWVSKELVAFMAANYVGKGNARDPRCSPVFADLNGLPPLYVMGGEAEILYSDQVRLVEAARKAGVDVTFEPWKHMIHVFPVFISMGIPESRVAIDRIAAFLSAQMKLSMLR